MLLRKQNTFQDVTDGVGAEAAASHGTTTSGNVGGFGFCFWRGPDPL